MTSRPLARVAAGVPTGGQFATSARSEASVSLTVSSDSADHDPADIADPGPPPGDAWERRVSEYTGLVSYQRDFEVRDGLATHTVNGLLPGEEPARDGEAVVLGNGGITIEQKGRYPGQVHYKVLDAPMLDFDGNDTGERVTAIHINWIEVERNRGKGWASAMYQAIRDAHPHAIIPAASNLEPPGRRVVKHYRGKHPEAHTGRFDTDGRIHPTTGPDDPKYRAEMLTGPSGER